MLKLKVLLIFGLVNSALITVTSGDDQPDRFAYHAKLLSRMINMEIKMERMEEELKQTETNISTFTKNQAGILDNKTAELELFGERVELPLVAFDAYQPVDTSPDTNEIMVWRYTRLNEGKGYDTVLGTFKAPVSGLYYFAVHACNYSTRYFQYAIVLENTYIATTNKYDSNNHDCGSMSTFARVEAGQKVWVKCTSGSTNVLLRESHGRSSFIGALIHK
ncbi:complement C1q and tumor necrosis factor-related protein 9B-like [Ruditapes philippinarum]|uniref:complement C1q and tumor necrosis factor-related protein 9B-like n=1 Tax=Ruditapes philippinarum TaxID=129788 RepID=UPI00295B6D5D|nr:complement C1q and tumor necrosis factor-related protein 9B-like [Ruditapes philippinarum]